MDLLFLIAAEYVVLSSLKAYQMRARMVILQKWKEGSLTLPELHTLKRTKWFQQTVLKPVHSIDSRKKYQ